MPRVVRTVQHLTKALGGIMLVMGRTLTDFIMADLTVQTLMVSTGTHLDDIIIH